MRILEQHFDRVSSSWEFHFGATNGLSDVPVPDFVSHVAYIVDPDEKDVCLVLLRLSRKIADAITLRGLEGAELSYNGRKPWKKSIGFATDDRYPHPLARHISFESRDVLRFYLRRPG